MSDTLRLVEDLIARPSVTPADHGCQDLIAQRLTALGFVAEHLPFGPEDFRVQNLWAVHDGGRPGPTVVFAGHTDVVPTGPAAQWTSAPFVPSYRDGKLFARGAADMKTSLAAMVVAAEEFVRARPGHAGGGDADFGAGAQPHRLSHGNGGPLAVDGVLCEGVFVETEQC